MVPRPAGPGPCAGRAAPACGSHTKCATLRESRTAGTCIRTRRPRLQSTAERRPPQRKERNCQSTGRPGRAHAPEQPVLHMGVTRNTPPSAGRGRQGHARQRCALHSNRQLSGAPHQGIREIAGAQAGLGVDARSANRPARGGTRNMPPSASRGRCSRIVAISAWSDGRRPPTRPPAPASQWHAERDVRSYPGWISLPAAWHWPRQDGAMVPQWPPPAPASTVAPATGEQPGQTQPR